MFKNLSKLIPILILIFGFTALLYSAIDYDTWWHIKLGENILEGTPPINSFTYTCEEYLWINHSHFGSVFFFLTFQLGGFAFLNLVIALIYFLGILFNFSSISYLLRKTVLFKKTLFRNLLLFCTFFVFIVVLATFLGPRPQAFNFLFLSIFFAFILRRGDKLTLFDYVFVTILSVVWINIHGGFVLSIVLVLIFLLKSLVDITIQVLKSGHVIKIREELNVLKKRFILLLVILLSSLLNPYGPFVWLEILNAILSSENYRFIAEWGNLDMSLFVGKFYIGILLTTLILLSIKRRYFFIFLVLIFGIVPIFSARYLLPNSIVVCIFFLYSIPENLEILLKSSFKTQLDKTYSYLKSLKILIITIFLLIFLLFSFSRVKIFFDDTKRYESYPVGAVEFIRSNSELINKKFLNEYKWGGFLAFQMPEKKWFIDGRMATWKCEGYLKKYILYDYMEIFYIKKHWLEVLDFYAIEATLLERESLLGNALLAIGWRLEFEDENSIILVR